MRLVPLPFLILVLMAPAGLGADPLQIRVPSTASITISGEKLKLTPEVIYPIDSDVPIRVLASPQGLVKVLPPEAGPLRVKGKFIDGMGKTETRNLTGKFIYFIEPVKTGTVEVLVIPTGEPKPDDSDVKRQMVDVDAGTGPIPPPDPPQPKPPSALQVRLQAAFDKDPVTPTRAADKQALVNSYRFATKLAQDQTYITRGDLVGAAQRQTSANLGETGQPATKLFNTRRAAGDYLNEKTGTDNVNLTPDLRQKYVTEYTAVADALETLK